MSYALLLCEPLTVYVQLCDVHTYAAPMFK